MESGKHLLPCERSKGVGSHYNPNEEHQVEETGVATGHTGHGAREAPPFPAYVYTSVLYVCISIPALQIGSSVPFP